ncbi:hypothetical protein PMAYCL1PPCAC_12690 [Pristionchus mayeri]|uniref:Uncharacterized protein n=1 Tax=Pristionchus mayeri TaxID=1317129 RepID=A0AAN4ZSS3_9BILA|nr:hypothetical protein PMAYCL1PPCAC_12690 [Pristionchus mayeri]
MGSDQSRLRHSHSSREKTASNLPSIKLPPSSSAYEMRDSIRSRSGSTSSMKTSTNSPRHPIPLKARRLIQSTFANPHDSIGKRAVKRSCETKPEFTSFYVSMDSSSKEEFEENVKLLLNRVVANIDYVEEIERLSEEFGRDLVEWRTKGFKADLLCVLADAVCKECLHLDSAVHRAHTTTHAFSQLGSLIFSSVRNGFYMEIRKKRRTSNSFSSGGSGSSRRDKKKGEDGTSKGSLSLTPPLSFSSQMIPLVRTPLNHATRTSISQQMGMMASSSLLLQLCSPVDHSDYGPSDVSITF